MNSRLPGSRGLRRVRHVIKEANLSVRSHLYRKQAEFRKRSVARGIEVSMFKECSHESHSCSLHLSVAEWRTLQPGEP